VRNLDADGDALFLGCHGERQLLPVFVQHLDDVGGRELVGGERVVG